MNPLEARLSQLVQEAREVPLVDLPRLRGLLMEAEAALVLRLRMEGPQADPHGTTREGAMAATERWITPAEAAAIAQVPVKRLYEWARGKRWASRPTRRCLRIHEGGFRAWLVASGRT